MPPHSSVSCLSCVCVCVCFGPWTVFGFYYFLLWNVCLTWTGSLLMTRASLTCEFVLSPINKLNILCFQHLHLGSKIQFLVVLACREKKGCTQYLSKSFSVEIHNCLLAFTWPYPLWHSALPFNFLEVLFKMTDKNCITVSHNDTQKQVFLQPTSISDQI